MKKPNLRKIINPVIVLLTFADIYTWGVYYIVVSLLGLYLANRLGHDPIEIVGIGVGIRFVVRAIVQIPVGMISDRIKNDIDEIILLMVGITLMALPIILFMFITSATQYYILEAIFGVGAGLNIVDWRKLFAKNLDQDKEGWSYAVYDTVMSLSTALFGFVGGYIANLGEDYFRLVILAVGILMLGSNFWVLLLYKLKSGKNFSLFR